MGEWTEVNGTHNSKRVSMRKLVKFITQDDELVFDHQDNGQEFCFRFPYSGLYAAETISKIAVEFKRLDKNARLHMEAKIDFYT